ncbi:MULTISPECIES: PAS domain S-box protein [Cyanophyceae]|uniref:PAS domain S-box protein n=1 Tax=Cyanophyceae TaxID=3028117 RepID=UPI0016890B50|nr:MULTISPECIES: PAS domain S-box protein [Cyanophyceae]MBD1918822.1 PAS domain S-box protein [Phormidium sp. FACHB-77]MBD2033335.1 PAS domain S-box protein [Phormidium sp. FACHB-322]MBD2053732.1 PAS domain S-box protein [Leptolyngbya sp. FACHB-60]
MAEVDDLRRLVQQLKAENADLQRQVASLQQAGHNQHQVLPHNKDSGNSQPVSDRSLSQNPALFQAPFQDFVTYAPILAWITDAQGTMIYGNPAWLAMVNLTEQEAIGQSVEAIFPAPLAQTYRQNNQWVLDHQTVLETVEQAPSTDGTMLTCLVRKFPMQAIGATSALVGGIGVDITELKQTESALRDSEARWQFAIEGSGNGLWDRNVQSNEVFFSHQWKAMLGYADDEIGTSLDEWDSRVHPDDRAGCYADLEKHFNGETPVYQKEYRIRCKDGSYKWILDRGKVMERDADGKPLRVIGTHKDISEKARRDAERKQAEIHQQQLTIILRQSEATNRAIIEAIPDLLLRVGRDGTCLSFLPPADAAAGTFLAVQNHLSEVLPPDLLRYQLQRMERALSTGELQTWEHQFEKHGQLCYEEVRLAPCGPDQCLVIVRDVSDRKQIELQLQTTAEELDRFFSVSLDLLCIGNTSGYFHRLNGQWEKTLGYSVQEMQGTRYIDYVHPEDIGATLAAFSSLTQQQEIRNFVNRYRCRDGSYRWIEWRSVPVGHLVYGAARDVTDRMQAELELQRTKDQLDLVLQASAEGYWDWNLETGVIYFSPQWKAMLGYADHELDNSLAAWEAVSFANDRAIALHLIDDYNSGRVEEFSVTQRFHHKNGSTVHILSRAIHQKNAAGQVIRMVGSHLDVTAMVTIQAALQTSEMQLASVLNSSLDGIMVFKAVRDESGVIVDFEWLLSNPAACKIVGRTAEYLIGKRLLDELPGHKTDGLFDLYVRVTESGNPAQRQFHYNHDGLDTWFENMAVKLGDGFAVTFSDITPLKRAEHDLQRVNQQLAIHVGELNQRTRQMQLLGEMSDFLQACLTVNDAYRSLGALVAPLFPGSSGGILMLTDGDYRVEQVATWGAQRAPAPKFIPLDCSALCRERLHQVSLDCLRLGCGYAESTQILTNLCIPLLAQSQTLGLFYLSTSDPSELVQQLARTVAEQVALALANLYLRETLQQQSIRDPLTGLFNRRYLEETLIREVQRAQRQCHTIGIIMLDIDHFKRVNDTYGHDAGDRVLETVGQLLRQSVRGSDVACRYGGEEMLLILPESPPEATLARAEEIRQALSLLQVSYSGLTLDALSASLGVASFPDHGLRARDVLKAADDALYQAKARGRNQVVVATVPATKVAEELRAPLPRDIS